MTVVHNLSAVPVNASKVHSFYGLKDVLSSFTVTICSGGSRPVAQSTLNEGFKAELYESYTSLSCCDGEYGNMSICTVPCCRSGCR